MTGPEDIDALAAEYVLGTLDPGERAAVAARRQRDTGLERAIADWERRLGPLADMVPPVQPAPGVFARIEKQLASAAAAPDAGGLQLVALDRRVRRWRRIASAATALAASLALFIGVREVQRPPAGPRTFVAVMQKDDASPSFLVTVDLETRLLTVRPVAAEAQPNRSYQLWMAHASFDGPRSLGLVEDRDLAPRPVLAAYDRGVIENATFAVSVEPTGGSPTGKPTGPVLFHAKLIQTR